MTTNDAIKEIENNHEKLVAENLRLKTVLRIVYDLALKGELYEKWDRVKVEINEALK
jgi:hypothetical protein